MNRRRVKITGIGPVTPAGIGKVAYTEGIRQSVSRISPLTGFDVAAGPFVAAQIPGFRINDYVSAAPKKLPRHTQFAMAAAKLALDDAGLSVDRALQLDPVVVLGAVLMDFEVMNASIEGVTLKGPRRALGRAVSNSPIGGISSAISEILFRGRARAMALQTACCAGLDAIGYGAEMVASGQSDIVICGGTEAPLFYHPMIELKMAGMAPDNGETPARQCRPFDMWRTTGVIGEGAAMLVLEPEESPREAYAYIRGYAFASDEPALSGSGLKTAMIKALANASLRIDQVDSINAWGPGHRVIDAVEAQAITQMLGPRTPEVPVFSIKGAIGNPLGASGAMQAACAAVAIAEEFIPPTVNFEYADPGCPLRLSNTVLPVRSDVMLINAHGLSGTNCAVVVARSDD